MPENTQPTGCPICGTPMEPVEVRNSLSRYTDRYICNRCGAMEAMFGLDKMHPDGRECLYHEPVYHRLALVNEKINGFKELAIIPAANLEFVLDYIARVNKAMGYGAREVLDIVSNSMFTAELTWAPANDERNDR